MAVILQEILGILLEISTVIDQTAQTKLNRDKVGYTNSSQDGLRDPAK